MAPSGELVILASRPGFLSTIELAAIRVLGGASGASSAFDSGASVGYTKGQNRASRDAFSSDHVPDRNFRGAEVSA